MPENLSAEKGDERNDTMKRQLILSGLLTWFFVSPALASEIFVAPVPVLPARVGNYEVTVSTDLSFTFALPNDMTAFTGAKIVLLPSQAGSFTFNYDLSIAKNAELHNSSGFGPINGSGTAVVGKIQEIDVTALFTTAFLGGANPGEDYIGFNWKSNSLTRAQVLGLRFVYEGESGGGPATNSHRTSMAETMA
jgi:hypothetical protein